MGQFRGVAESSTPSPREEKGEFGDTPNPAQGRQPLRALLSLQEKSVRKRTHHAQGLSPLRTLLLGGKIVLQMAGEELL